LGVDEGKIADSFGWEEFGLGERLRRIAVTEASDFSAVEELTVEAFPGH
jgi:hypothetical protein